MGNGESVPEAGRCSGIGSAATGRDADVVDEEGLIETTRQFSYGDYGVSTDSEDDRPDRVEVANGDWGLDR